MQRSSTDNIIAHAIIFYPRSRPFDVTLMNIRPKHGIKIQIFSGTTPLWKWVNLWPKKSLRKNENQHVVSNTRLYPIVSIRWWIVPLDHKLTVRKTFKSERQSTSDALSCAARAMADLYTRLHIVRRISLKFRLLCGVRSGGICIIVLLISKGNTCFHIKWKLNSVRMFGFSRRNYFIITTVKYFQKNFPICIDIFRDKLKLT